MLTIHKATNIVIITNNQHIVIDYADKLEFDTSFKTLDKDYNFPYDDSHVYEDDEECDDEDDTEYYDSDEESYYDAFSERLVRDLYYKNLHKSYNSDDSNEDENYQGENDSYEECDDEDYDVDDSYDEDFELDTEDETNFQVDLKNFPDPSNFMNLTLYGIQTEEDFKQWWFENKGQQIIKFQSFTPPVNDSDDDSDQVLDDVSREDNEALQEVDCENDYDSLHDEEDEEFYKKILDDELQNKIMNRIEIHRGRMFSIEHIDDENNQYLGVDDTVLPERPLVDESINEEYEKIEDEESYRKMLDDELLQIESDRNKIMNWKEIHCKKKFVTRDQQEKTWECMVDGRPYNYIYKMQ
jgi:hypothetical protein